MYPPLAFTTFLMQVTAGFMVAVAIAAFAVALISRKSENRFAYGILAVAAIAGAATQISLALFPQTPLAAAFWHADALVLAIVAVLAYLAFHAMHWRYWRRLCVTALVIVFALVLLNHTSPGSLHGLPPRGAAATGMTWHEPLFMVGDRDMLPHFTYGVLALCTLATAVLVFHQRHHFRLRAWGLVLGYLALQLVGLARGWYIDGLPGGQIDAGAGFALTLLLAWISAATAMDAAARSKRLVQREREMQVEVLQRRKAEDKLQRLSQVFMQAPAPTHIVDLDGRVSQVNLESVRYLHRDLSEAPNVNFLAMLERLGVDTGELLVDLRSGQAREMGPFWFTAQRPIESFAVIRDAWLKFKAYPILDQYHQLHEFVLRLEDTTNKRFVDNAIKIISHAVSTQTGHAFFTELVVHLARLLEQRTVLIGVRKTIDAHPCIETLAMAIDGELVQGFHYRLANTLSEQVLRQGNLTISAQAHGVLAEQQPGNPFDAESFLGVAIQGEHDQAVGLLAVLDTKPLEKPEQLQELVTIFANRAGTELQRSKAETTIRRMAFEDFLTGLPNRTALNQHVTELLKVNQPRQVSAFIQLDLDHFKTINDALGHDVGDDVILALSRRLAGYRDERMLVARIGGDEFAVVVSNLGDQVAQNLDTLARELMALMERPVQVGDHLLDVGCTMGVVLFPDYAHTAVDVFRSADIALYKAKAAGARGDYQMFTPEMRDSVSRRLNIEKGLRRALQNDELRLFFQPQLSADGQLIGAETLIRWQHPEQGLIPPLAFIPVAEESGLIHSVGQWVLNSALATRQQWSEQGLPYAGHLSVNVSAWQFGRPDFVDSVLAAIEQARVPAEQLTLEVTETALLSDIQDTIDKLRELRKFGIKIALDDFGTGYSSLAYLRDLPLDILKIDKAFVGPLETTSHEPLLESMIAIGKHMGLVVVAEGVETQRQFERLQTLGCQVFQGYWLAKPMPEDSFRKWVLRADSDALHWVN